MSKRAERPFPIGTPIVVKALNEHENRGGIVIDCPPRSDPARDALRFVRFHTERQPVYAWLPVADLYTPPKRGA